MFDVWKEDSMRREDHPGLCHWEFPQTFALHASQYISFLYRIYPDISAFGSDLSDNFPVLLNKDLLTQEICSPNEFVGKLGIVFSGRRFCGQIKQSLCQLWETNQQLAFRNNLFMELVNVHDYWSADQTFILNFILNINSLISFILRMNLRIKIVMQAILIYFEPI